MHAFDAVIIGLLKKIPYVTYNNTEKSQIPVSSIMKRRKGQADALFSKRWLSFLLVFVIRAHMEQTDKRTSCVNCATMRQLHYTTSSWYLVTLT